MMAHFQAPVSYTANYCVGLNNVNSQTAASSGKPDPKAPPIGSHVPATQQVLGGAVRRQVLITPLTSTQLQGKQISQINQPTTGQATRIINKLLIKVFLKVAKKESKTYTLRDIDTTKISTVDQLKRVIKSQLQGEIHEHFNVGYLHGSNHVTIRTAHDVSDLWADVLKATSVMLWCDGLKTELTKPSTSQTRKHGVGSDNESGKEECLGNAPKKRKTAEKGREEKVEEIVSTLKQKHGKLYTQMQYRIWGEMVIGNLHSSVEEPPGTSMFMRAGGSTPKRTKSDEGVREALTFVADRISSLLSPSSSSSSTPGTPLRTSSSTGAAGSPAKLIDNRTKCYKQLAELNNLRSSGVLNESEYHTEKDSIMATLKCLQT